MSIMQEFQISEADLMEMPLDEIWIKNAWLNLKSYRQYVAIHGKPSEDRKSKEKGRGLPSDSQDERWRSMTKEEQLPGGRVKVTHRVNVMDLWEHPELLHNALSGK